MQSQAITPRACLHCSKSFTPSRQQVENGWGKFCSNTCKGAAKSAANVQPTKPCAQCGQPFSGKASYLAKHDYCSNLCRGLSMRTGVERPCDICGAIYVARGDTFAAGMGRYCSKACSNRSRRITATDRFWPHVDRRGPDECWPWMAARDHNGYGLFTLETGKQITAHRFALIEAVGPIPDEIEACHHCDNPPCCNEDHLFPGTPKQNQEDSSRKGRKRHGGSHHASKLSEMDVVVIRQRYAAGGISQDRLAGEYNVSQFTISCVIRHETWKHV